MYDEAANYTPMEVNVAVLALHHVSVIVADTTRALAFYCDVLGLETVDRPDLGYPGAWLQAGAQQIHLLQLPNPDSSENRPEHGGRDRHLALLVDDLEAIEQRLVSRSMFFTRSKSGRKALFCRDYDGNAVELIAES